MKNTPQTASKPTPKLTVKVTAPKSTAKPTCTKASKATAVKPSAKPIPRAASSPTPITPNKPASTAKAKSPAVKLEIANASRTNKTAPTPSKQAQLIAMLRSSEGCTLEHMTEVTGWQAHTVRGTISGVLRKRLALDVQSALPASGGPRVYRIVEQTAKQPAGQNLKQASA